MSRLKEIREKAQFYQDMFKYTNYNCDEYNGEFYCMNNEIMVVTEEMVRKEIRDKKRIKKFERICQK